MYSIRYPTNEENHAKWYSRDDEASFKRQKWRDVAKYSSVLSSNVNVRDDESKTKERLLKCVGIDHLLSRDVVKKSQEITLARKVHVRAVLRRQEVLLRHGIEDPEDLAQVAMSSSRFARERSHRVAVMMMAL